MKNYFLTIISLVAISISVTFTSCKDKNPINKKDEVDTNIAGTISKGEIKTLKSDIVYKLNGSLIVEAGGVLNIEAGTTIRAEKGFSKYILVLQGGKIYAKGKPEKPITFTADSDNATSGYWGGIIINGYAPISGAKGVEAKGTTEINVAYKYGGNNKSDSSGELSYVKILYSGARSSAKVEHNGLTLNGVGYGTKIENIYVANAADDGIEFFGGSVNVTGLLVVNPDDDMFDFTQGYSGTLKNCYGIWEKGYTSTEEDPRGVEADGNLDGINPNDINQSNFKITNMTIDLQLDKSKSTNDYMHDVIKIRRGATATITNALVKGSGTAKDLIDLTDKKGNASSETNIVLTNKLSNPNTGKPINGENYNAKIVDGNSGCDSSIFLWSGYKF